MSETAIEWTERTWNPIVGCTIVSPGCTNCYAMKMARRVESTGTPAHYAGLTQETKAGAVWTGRVVLAPGRILLEPLRRKKPTTYFVNSMGDLFHENVSDEWIDRVFAVMALTPQHTYQVLTKRSARMRAYMSAAGVRERVALAAADLVNEHTDFRFRPQIVFKRDNGFDHVVMPWPLQNIWLGVSAEDQRRADERIPDLLATPAAIRFVSAEPLLGPIDFTRCGNLSTIRSAIPDVVAREERKRPLCGPGSISGFQIDAVGSSLSSVEFFQTPDHMGGFSTASPRRFPRLDWIIVGGESGPNARPMHPVWARQIRDQCAAAGTAFFFKQWGEWSPHTAALEDAEGAIRTSPRGGVNWQAEKPGGAFGVFRVGKKRAGRLLDGVEHNAMPEQRP